MGRCSYARARSSFLGLRVEDARNERKERGGGDNRKRRKREEVKGARDEPRSVSVAIPCQLVTVTSPTRSRHASPSTVTRVCRINSVYTTHKDRIEERFKVMTTWDLISARVGTETAVVILPDALGNSQPE